ncbi:MAG: quinone-dependent dihydroorotate dehydrogenase [Cyclobacteriaceae bacterium]|nr:quinone-dependent dihydroorotate dehydrogenase [Cyclobacteriaceae bacterium]
MYKIFIRPLLFLLAPEKAHHFTFAALYFFCKLPGVKKLLSSWFVITHPSLERKILGLTFKNPIGLAAGFDKDAKLIGEMACFGFGFIEIGTLTPLPQAGNEKPRLFRLPEDQALINRMGFNNEGVLAAVERLKKRQSSIIVGGNIGKNKITPNEQAIDDYVYCFEALHPHVDYFVVNVSSPNTPGLRELQEKAPLKNLLTVIKQLSLAKDQPKPVLLKIAPDLTVGQLDDIIDILKETGTDGVIATNTTITREDLKTSSEVVHAIGVGGLSGKPLAKKSTEVIKYLRSQLGPSFPIIGVGGIMTPNDAVEKFQAGADLVQIYTGFVYEGPAFVSNIVRLLVSDQVKHT